MSMPKLSLGFQPGERHSLACRNQISLMSDYQPDHRLLVNLETRPESLRVSRPVMASRTPGSTARPARPGKPFQGRRLQFGLDLIPT